ncbi:complement C1q tumor necrosis factor-related protein 6-like isoform X1 [Parambassis ranga]|uniref:Complement C1q tumor necrosis factor-related protein 6-like isoform X1 n=1 Tax=Parambassis ranga TaxID=210632 RepID=A0A6P7JJG2_9TELE|nr:complement C1q tumor necrosis factor-related protein 6-like isoform X1 [Parambassis ranga]
MKTTVMFLLCLLAGSDSKNLTEAEKEVLAQQVEYLQPCPLDIHAVLREMAASLAVQKEEIKSLQRQNTENLEKLNTESTQLRKQLQEQVTNLEKQKTETDQLKQQLQVKQVAFSTSLLGEGHSVTLGPFNTHTPLIFKRVFTNIGNAYSPHTGIFTAPVKGVYNFEWCISAGGGPNPTGAVLYRNSELISIAYEHQPSHFSSGSNAATLLLQPGDQVFLRQWVNSQIFDNGNHHTTFSGHLVFTM